MVQQWEKLEAHVKVKSCADSLFKLLTEEVHIVPKASSEFKEKVEIYEEKGIMTLVTVGGDILEQYHAHKIVYHDAPDGDSIRVNLQIVSKKFDENQDDPDNPDDYLWFLINILKGTDAHLVGKPKDKCA